MQKIECDVSSRGSRNFELEVEYPVAPDAPLLTYKLDMYLFCPYQLGINKEHYSVKQFLEDTHSYTRYTIPVVSLEKLIDPECDRSPLNRIPKTLCQSVPKTIDVEAVLYELRMFTNIFNRQIKAVRQHIQKTFDEKTVPAPDECNIEKFLAEMSAVMDKYRSAVLPNILIALVPNSVRLAANWADERIGFSAEKQLMKIYAIIQKCPSYATSAAAVLTTLNREIEYRISKGYKTVGPTSSEKDNEKFLYHEGVLKKWAESCLYMSTPKNRASDRVAQILIGVAAGVAMLFAVAATIIATKWFPPDSVPWAILIVIMYVFKDRIKESLRGIFSAWLPKFFADKTEDLVDPKIRLRVGGGRISVQIAKSKSKGIDENITRFRYMSTNEFRDILPPEDVINFHKEIRFNSAELTRHHQRLESLTEILRFNLNSFLENMDDAISNLPRLKNDEIEKVAVRRLYHIHLLVHLRGTEQNTEKISHFRLDLTKDGIARIEHIRTVSQDTRSDKI